MKSSELLMKSITVSHGHSTEVVKALADVIWKAEKYDKLKDEVESHAPHGRNYTNQQYVNLLTKYNEIKEVMGFYANEENWYYSLNSIAVEDCGERARKALSGSV